MKLDPSVRVFVRGRENFLADRGLDSQLLIELARHACGERFIRITFAAGKFPHAGEVHARLPSRHQVAVASLDDRGGDDHRLHDDGSGVKGYDRHIFDMGQTRHFGFRAVQTMAPRSMSA